MGKGEGERSIKSVSIIIFLFGHGTWIPIFVQDQIPADDNIMDDGLYHYSSDTWVGPS